MPQTVPSVVIENGSVFDAVRGRFDSARLVVDEGRLSADPPASGGGDGIVIDATGLLIVPGLVDLHTHIFQGQDAGVAPDALGAKTGVTTMVDAGSAGAHLFGAFAETTIARAATRVVAFLNIASIGITSFRLRGELRTLDYCDTGAAIAAVSEHRRHLVGVKVRASADVGGENAVEALRRARVVADATDLPLMVHLGPAPASVDDILDRLAPGDILTHCFTGFPGNAVADASPRPSVRRAYERGVVFDVGHGGSGFDATVARTMLDHGFPPHTISSDVHHYSIDSIPGLPDAMSKMLALGLPLESVIAAVTSRPASVVGLDRDGVGSLLPGSVADIAGFRLVERDTEFTDGHGHTFSGTRQIEPAFTIRNGTVVFSDLDASNR